MTVHQLCIACWTILYFEHANSTWQFNVIIIMQLFTAHWCLSSNCFCNYFIWSICFSICHIREHLSTTWVKRTAILEYLCVFSYAGGGSSSEQTLFRRFHICRVWILNGFCCDVSGILWMRSSCHSSHTWTAFRLEKRKSLSFAIILFLFQWQEPVGSPVWHLLW